MAVSDLFNAPPPQDVTGTVGSSNQLPNWYQDYLQGIASQGASVASRGYQQYPGQQLAGFTPDQLSAFQLAENQVGGYKPYMQGALNSMQQANPLAQGAATTAGNYGAGALGSAQGAGANANASVAGPAATWTNNWQQYMSPYTSSVVNEIGRLGNQNLNENILPGINDSFIGSGGFGSTRNADMLGRGIRDAQTNTSGLQSQALQSGYGTAANIFGSDAARQQQQQQLQANTALGAGQLGANTGLSAGNMALSGGQLGAQTAANTGQQLGALGQLGQSLGYQDVGALGGAGALQQQQQQQGINIGLNNFNTQQGWDMSQLGNLSNLVRGMPLTSQQTSVTNQPYGNVGSSPFQWATALYGLANTNSPAPSSSTGP
jgi:hypothetical protein